VENFIKRLETQHSDIFPEDPKISPEIFSFNGNGEIICGFLNPEDGDRKSSEKVTCHHHTTRRNNPPPPKKNTNFIFTAVNISNLTTGKITYVVVVVIIIIIIIIIVFFVFQGLGLLAGSGLEFIF
jgi:hypothetical protein